MVSFKAQKSSQAKLNNSDQNKISVEIKFSYRYIPLGFINVFDSTFRTTSVFYPDYVHRFNAMSSATGVKEYIFL